MMLTGDNEKTAAAIGKEAGVDEVRAAMRPEDKAAFVKSLSKVFWGNYMEIRKFF